MCAAAVLLTGLTAATNALPPVDPLPAPLFSFEAASPTVVDGHVPADGILQVDSPYPTIAIPGEEFGLGLEGDELDALSLANESVAPNTQLALLFSVDVDSVGAAPPDPDLVTAGVPHNVLDQASRNQAAGDQFMSTVLFVRAGDARAALQLTLNNVLVRNNFDEGGVDFSARPPTAASDAIFDEPQDDVDATITAEELTTVYFSASATSPSLAFLPGFGGPSGAHVFLALLDLGQTALFASFTDLGLVQGDEVDALLVFDTGSVGVFDDSDVILFSLAPDSPSLGTIPGVSSPGGAADVLSVTPGGLPEVFASAADLGLGHADDNLDALDYVICDVSTACAAAHGIRGESGGSGVPTVSHWGINILTLLLLIAATIIISRRRPA